MKKKGVKPKKKGAVLSGSPAWETETATFDQKEKKRVTRRKRQGKSPKKSELCRGETLSFIPGSKRLSKKKKE